MASAQPASHRQGRTDDPAREHPVRCECLRGTHAPAEKATPMRPMAPHRPGRHRAVPTLAWPQAGRRDRGCRAGRKVPKLQPGAGPPARAVQRPQPRSRLRRGDLARRSSARSSSTCLARSSTVAARPARASGVALTKTPFPGSRSPAPSARSSATAARTTVMETPYISRSFAVDGIAEPTGNSAEAIRSRRSRATCWYAGPPTGSATWPFSRTPGGRDARYRRPRPAKARPPTLCIRLSIV